MALVQWGWGMKVMHEGRLDGVRVASSSQKRERGAPTHVLWPPSLIIDLKGRLDGKKKWWINVQTEERSGSTNISLVHVVEQVRLMYVTDGRGVLLALKFKAWVCYKITWRAGWLIYKLENITGYILSDSVFQKKSSNDVVSITKQTDRVGRRVSRAFHFPSRSKSFINDLSCDTVNLTVRAVVHHRTCSPPGL